MSAFRLTLVLLAVANYSSAQQLAFRALPAGAQAPAARFDGAVAYAQSTVYLFGGQSSSPLNDAWAYSLEKQEWTELAVSGTRPPARFGHTVLFDPVRNRLVIFGGQTGGFFSDVWALDLRLLTWQQLSPNDAGPRKRYGHSAVYDPVRDRMVISHGFTDSGRFDDTWAFSLVSNKWTEISPAANRPLRRCLHHAVYDPLRDSMYLYGGCSSGFGPCPQDDLWSLDFRSGQWTQLTASPKPSGREHYGMSFDSLRDRLVLFGGDGTSGLLNDTWEYDPGAKQWSQTSAGGTMPSARNRHEAVFAADRKATYFFGGSTAAGLTNELLALEAAPSLAVRNALSNQVGPFAPGEIVSIYGSGLGPAAGVVTAFSASGTLPVSGGGISVTVGGVAAPLYFVQANQINFQIPYELAGRDSADVVTGSQTIPISLSAVHPGVLGIVFDQDGSVNSAARPAGAGEVITFYATGQGVTSPASVTGAAPQNGYPAPKAPVTVEVGGAAADVLFAGQAPGTAGIMQVNVRLPVVKPGQAAVVLVVGGQRSQDGVSVWLR